jgi:hypothetical protein
MLPNSRVIIAWFGVRGVYRGELALLDWNGTFSLSQFITDLAV